jgi:hypothetical protein
MSLVRWLFSNDSIELKNLNVGRLFVIILIILVSFLVLRWLLKWLFKRIAKLFKPLGKAIKERRINQRTEKAAKLREDETYDLIFLHERGFVRARATGQSITEIYAKVENLIRKKLKVIVKPGTYFLSSGSHQNMVTRTEYTFMLWPCSTQHLGIKSSCINASRPIPGRSDRFYGVARVSDDLARFLEATQDIDPMVVQAGVWAITDGYSAHDVQTRLVARDQYGNTRQAVSNAQITEARRILDRLGISHKL